MKDKKGTSDPPSSIREHLELVEEYFKRHMSEVSKQPKEKTAPSDIAFAISLKSKTVSRDWSRVQTNLANTLRSVLRNTDQHYRIIVAGHEKPEIEELQDDRVTWLPVDFPPPENSSGFSSDKMHKRRVIGAYLRKIDFFGYFMPLDADDWIHYRLVEFIRSLPFSNAFILKKGFMVNTGRNEVWMRNNFYRGCGSSAIFYFSNHDFPSTSEKKDVQRIPFRITLKSHTNVQENLENINKDYTMVDFPLVTYVLGHGDNIEVIKGKKDNMISKINAQNIENWFYNYFIIRDI